LDHLGPTQPTTATFSASPSDAALGLDPFKTANLEHAKADAG
jgi:hypothetical protein